MTATIRLDGLEIVVDSSDLEVISRHSWVLDGEGTPITWKAKKTTLGRLLLGNPSAKVIFRDGCSTNYTRENLIDANAGPSKRATKQRKVRFKGVTREWRRTKYVWRAQIWNGYKNILIGRFDSPEEAAKAYDEMARRLSGDKAVLNGVQDDKGSEVQPDRQEVVCRDQGEQDRDSAGSI